MKNKLIRDETDSKRKWILAFNTGDQVISEIENFTEEHEIQSAHFTAIGAFLEAELYFFDWESKEYQSIPVDEQTEVLSLIGNIGWIENKVKVHAHVTLGRHDASVLGGHLKEAIVRPTLELFLDEGSETLQRSEDEETGLALVKMTNSK